MDKPRVSEKQRRQQLRLGLVALVSIPIVVFIGVGSPSTTRSDISPFGSFLASHLLHVHIVAGVAAVLSVLCTGINLSLGRMMIVTAMLFSLGATVSADLIASDREGWSTPVALVLFLPLAVAVCLDLRLRRPGRNHG